MSRVRCTLGIMGVFVAMTLAACGPDAVGSVDAGPTPVPVVDALSPNDGGSVCGDNQCDSSESHETCPGDCPLAGSICGDGICNNGETLETCAIDCPAGGVFCGDGVCNGNESTSTCTADCQITTCSTQPDNCTGENICVSGTCVSAFGRVYRIVVVDGMISAADSNGDDWDAFNGLPDPMVQLTLNGTVIGTTASRENTLSPVWNQYATAVIPAGSSFVVKVLDHDVQLDDTMFTCQSNPLTANLLRIHGSPYASCSGTGAISDSKVRIYFAPQ